VRVPVRCPPSSRLVPLGERARCSTRAKPEIARKGIAEDYPPAVRLGLRLNEAANDSPRGGLTVTITLTEEERHHALGIMLGREPLPDDCPTCQSITAKLGRVATEPQL
jgi:hypothetical protein